MKKIVLLFLCTSLIFLSACWDARELSDIGIVVMTGFDLDDDGNERVTVLSVQPFGQASSQGSTSSTWIGTASGKSAYEAMRNLRRISTRTLIWLHNKIVIIGENKAKQGISNLNDILSRSREYRYDIAVFVTNGRADDMMQTPANVETGLFRELMGIIESTGEWSKGFSLKIKDLALNSIASYQHGFVIGNMGFYETDKIPFSTNSQEYYKLFWKDTDQPVAFISGGAVMDFDRLVGWLSPIELRAYLMITNQLEGEFVLTEQIPEMNMQVAVEVSKLKSEIKIDKADDGKFSVKVSVEASGRLAEVEGTISEHNESVMKRFKEIMEQEIRSELELIVRRAQNELRTDFINFHKVFSIEYSKEWKELSANWCEVFCKIPVEYEVELAIRSEGLVSRTYHSEEY